MSETEDAMASLSTKIQLPVERKAQLELLCASREISMREYVQGLVHAALAVEGGEDGHGGGRDAGRQHAEFEELRECKYGCNYRTTSKSGLAQHEDHCTYQRSKRAQQQAREAEEERGSPTMKLI